MKNVEYDSNNVSYSLVPKLHLGTPPAGALKLVPKYNLGTSRFITWSADFQSAIRQAE